MADSTHVRSCDSCNKRKVKCDRHQPMCSECARASLTCSYARRPKKRGRPLTRTKNLDPPPPSNPYTAQPISPQAQEELLDAYFRFCDPGIPIIHKNTFSLATAPPILVYAMNASAARYTELANSRGANEFLQRIGDPFYVKATQLLNENIDESVFTTVQALLLMSFYACASGRRMAFHMHSVLAIRMAQILRLNIEPEFDELYPTSMSWLERETRRRVWWFCYMIDHYGTSNGDRTATIREHDCKIYLPCSEIIWNSAQSLTETPAIELVDLDLEIARVGSPIPFVTGFQFSSIFAHHVLLCKIFNKINEYRSGLANRKRARLSPFLDPEQELQFNSLDAALKNWMASLPNWARQAPFRPDSQTDPSAAQNSYVMAYLHILYNASVSMLYRPKVVFSLKTMGTLHASTYYNTCKEAAANVNQVLEFILATNPQLHFLSPMSGFFIYQVALIPIMYAKICRDPAEMALTQQKFVTYITALQNLGDNWYMVFKLYIVLKKVLHSLNIDLIPELKNLLLKDPPPLDSKKSILNEESTMRIHARAAKFLLSLGEISQATLNPPTNAVASVDPALADAALLTSASSITSTDFSITTTPFAAAPPLPVVIGDSMLSAFLESDQLIDSELDMWVDFFSNNPLEETQYSLWTGFDMSGEVSAGAGEGKGDGGNEFP